MEISSTSIKNRKEELIKATMQIVAENGLTDFTMKKVTERIGVSEALIYKHFESKDKLLFICFESVHKQIAALFAESKIPDIYSLKDLYATVYTLWMKYFTFLVHNSYRTIFYFEYRQSKYIKSIMKRDVEMQKLYFNQFIRIFNVFNERFHVLAKTSADHLWTFILDVSGIFAKRIIQGVLPNTSESYENVWRLISTGMLGLIQPDTGP